MSRARGERTGSARGGDAHLDEDDLLQVDVVRLGERLERGGLLLLPVGLLEHLRQLQRELHRVDADVLRRVVIRARPRALADLLALDDDALGLERHNEFGVRDLSPRLARLVREEVLRGFAAE